MEEITDLDEVKDECFVDIETQTMHVQCKNGFKKEYPISTALKGIGNEKGSFKTPLGKHEVCEKIGENSPMFTRFKSRKDTGIIYKQLNVPVNEDLILTRILRLRGLELGVNSGFSENGKNVDSFERCIYIHGTNREDLLKTPASYGCIRMGNFDIVELFSNISVGAIVDIRFLK